jgi:hypothetical protein
VFDNRGLRRILGLMNGDVMEGWRKLYKEELHKL